MTTLQITILVIGCIVTALPLFLLLCRAPTPLRWMILLIKAIKFHASEKLLCEIGDNKVSNWLCYGNHITWWQSIRWPLFLTLGCGALTAILILVIH